MLFEHNSRRINCKQLLIYNSFCMFINATGVNHKNAKRRYSTTKKSGEPLLHIVTNMLCTHVHADVLRTEQEKNILLPKQKNNQTIKRVIINVIEDRLSWLCFSNILTAWIVFRKRVEKTFFFFNRFQLSAHGWFAQKYFVKTSKNTWSSEGPLNTVQCQYVCFACKRG